MKYIKPVMTPEQLRIVLERARSSAAGKHRNKKKYTRKQKHRSREDS